MLSMIGEISIPSEETKTLAKTEQPCYLHKPFSGTSRGKSPRTSPNSISFVKSFSATSPTASEESKTEEPWPQADFEKITYSKLIKAAAACSQTQHRNVKSCLVTRRYISSSFVTPDRNVNSCCVTLEKRRSKVESCMSTPACASKSKRKKKSVRFHSSTKSWDGQRQEHALLEKLALDFWEDESNITVLDDLLDDGNQGMLTKLRNLLIAAIESAEQNLNDKGAELVPGGGKFGITLTACDIPKSKLLLSNIHEVHDILELTHALAL